jgi:type VI secretion system protein
VGQPVGNRDVVHRVVHGTIHSLSTTPIESKFLIINLWIGIYFGRDVDNTVMLEDPHRYISGHHAIIEYQAPDYFITDTSTNGVLVNDATLPVGDGNRVKLGLLLVLFAQKKNLLELPLHWENHLPDFPGTSYLLKCYQQLLPVALSFLMPDQKDKSDPFDGIKIPGFDDTHSRLLEGDKQNSPKIEQPPPAYKEVIQLPRAEKKEQQEVTADNILADNWFQVILTASV